MAITERGKRIEIKLNDKSVLRFEVNNINTNNVDTTSVKECLNSLCLLSNQIVNAQLKLDKLNLVIKQLNILQLFRLSSNEINKSEKEYFTFEHKFGLSNTLEVTITNKNAFLEDNLNNSYLIYCCIQTNKTLIKSESFNWLNKCEYFTALKPSNKQTLKLDLNEAIKSNYFPYALNVYLIFDIESFLDLAKKSDSNLNENYLFDANKSEEKAIKEFAVCIYKNEFNFRDYFDVTNSAELIGIQKAGENRQSESSFHYNLLMNCQRLLNNNIKLESLWSKIAITGIDSIGTFYKGIKGSLIFIIKILDYFKNKI